MKLLPFDIRAGEGRNTIAGFLTLFGLIAGHTLLETARDALFLQKLPALRLPWMYFAIALGAIVVSGFESRFAPRTSTRRQVGLLMLVAAAVTLGFYLLLPEMSDLGLYALYFWSGILATVIVTRFWGLMGNVFTVTQAKRVFAAVGAGSVTGAIAGSALAGALAMRADGRTLIFAAAALFAVASLAPGLFRLDGLSDAPRPERATERGGRRALKILWSRPYTKKTALLVLGSTVTLTLCDYLFKSTVARLVPPAELPRFFATFYLVMNIISLVVQLSLVNFLLKRVGINVALAVLPLFLLLGGVGMLFTGGLAAALLLKGADGSLRHSLHRTSTELLFVPMADEVKGRVKGMIDGLGQRGGQALASFWILSTGMMGPSERVVGAAVAVMSVLWISIAWGVKRHYLNLFRSNLAQHTPRFSNRGTGVALDLASLESIIETLNSARDTEVLAAIDLLAAENRIRLIPALLLYHPSTAVVVRTLELFTAARRVDAVPVYDRLARHPDPTVRAGALRARTAASPDEQNLRAALEDESPVVRAAAVVGLVSLGFETDDAVQEELRALVQSGSEDARLSLLSAITDNPSAAYEESLLELGRLTQPQICAGTARAMAQAPSFRFLPVLLPMLAHRETRSEARRAMAAVGARALAWIDVAMEDQTLPPTVRLHLPRTLAYFDPAMGAGILLKHFASEPDGLVRYKILRSLVSLRREHPDLVFDPQHLNEALEGTVEALFRLLHWAQILEQGARADMRRASPVGEMLRTLVDNKAENALDRLFQVLSLRYRSEDVLGIWRGLRSDDARYRASSEELLANLLASPLKEALLAYLDRIDTSSKLLAGQAYFTPRELSYDAVLARLMVTRAESIRCLAAHHVGELQLVQLRPELTALADHPSPFFREVIERALERLSPAALAGGVA